LTLPIVFGGTLNPTLLLLLPLYKIRMLRTAESMLFSCYHCYWYVLT